MRMTWRFLDCLDVIPCVSSYRSVLRYHSETLISSKTFNLAGADGPKPTCNPPIPELDVSAFKGEDGPLMVDRADQFNPNLASVGSTWAQAGCYEDSQKSLPFTGANQIYYDNKELDVTQCTTLCGKSNKKVAGLMKRGTNWVGAPSQPQGQWTLRPFPPQACQCADAIAPTALVSPDSCWLKCPGR